MEEETINKGWLSNQLPLWAFGAQSHWGTLGNGVEHTLQSYLVWGAKEVGYLSTTSQHSWTARGWCVCGDVDSLTFWPALVFSRAGSGSQRMLSERHAGSGGWMSGWLHGHDECGEERQGLHQLQSLTSYVAPRTRSVNSCQLSLHL